MSRCKATALSVAVVLAGGAALAQSDLIVDPWKRVVTGKAPAPAVPRAPGASRPPPADDGWFDPASTAAAPRPVVEPVAPMARLAEWPEHVPPASPAPAPTPIAEASHPLHPSKWAHVVPEIIDPWGPRRLAVYRDPIIVDPWAH